MIFFQEDLGKVDNFTGHFIEIRRNRIIFRKTHFLVSDSKVHIFDEIKYSLQLNEFFGCSLVFTNPNQLKGVHNAYTITNSQFNFVQSFLFGRNFYVSFNEDMYEEGFTIDHYYKEDEEFFKYSRKFELIDAFGGKIEGMDKIDIDYGIMNQVKWVGPNNGEIHDLWTPNRRTVYKMYLQKE